MTASADLVDRHVADLQQRGYTILRGALPAAAIGALDRDLAPRFAATPFGSGAFYGSETKRFGRLLVRSPHAADLVAHRLVRAIVERLLLPWCDRIQLNTTQAISVHPGAPSQAPHRDQDMWPAPKGEVEYLVNVMWPLGDFMPENGATLVWPASHGRRALEDALPGEPVAPVLEPGDALVFLGSTLHGAGANRTASERRGIVVGYALGWLRTHENQVLAYPPAIAATFPADLAALVGYSQHRPNLGGYEGRCPSILLAGADPDSPLGAIDALRPEQQEMVEAHAREQSERR